MGSKSKFNTQNFNIVKEYYYLVNFHNIFEPVVLPIYFLNRRAAKMALENYPKLKKRELKFFSIVRGAKLLNEMLNTTNRYGRLGYLYCKYNYPADCVSEKDRRNFRILMRRRLRRMGLYTKVQPKKTWDKLPKKIKPIKNRQKKANSPNTSARVFQIQRKPEYYYYYLIDKRISKKKGIIFEVDTLRYNTESGKSKLITIQLKRNDVISPFLISELWQIAKQNGHFKRLEKKLRPIIELLGRKPKKAIVPTPS